MSSKTLRPDYEKIAAAADVIAQYMQSGPVKREDLFCQQLAAEIFVKYEFFNPVRSFKIRGALNLVNKLHHENDVKRVVTCSTGNHGSAMAFACQKFGMPLTVVVPEGCDQSKVDLIDQFAAEILFLGRDLDEAKERIQEKIAGDGTVFVEDGSSPDIVAGTATIGLELIEQMPEIEVVVVPVGNGALIGGIGAAIKSKRPDIEIIGVQSENAPCMALSFQAGKPVDTEHCDTFASGMAVRVAIPAAVHLVNEVVDDMLLVSEAELKKAMANFYHSTGHLPEGAGAATLAAAIRHPREFAGRKVCLVATGANVDEALRREVIGGNG